MDYQDRLVLFENELALMFDEGIKDFTKACIEAAPDYVFEDCPSSSSGKYHPIEELGADGNIIHTKKVFSLAYELSTGLDCVKYRDEICAAALLHDLAKQGLEKFGHTLREHPKIMADLVADVYREGFKDKFDREIGLRIYYAIYYHYGPWTDKSYRKPLVNYTPSELTVYTADYISSKRFIQINYRRSNNVEFG